MAARRLAGSDMVASASAVIEPTWFPTSACFLAAVETESARSTAWRHASVVLPVALATAPSIPSSLKDAERVP